MERIKLRIFLVVGLVLTACFTFGHLLSLSDMEFQVEQIEDCAFSEGCLKKEGLQGKVTIETQSTGGGGSYLLKLSMKKDEKIRLYSYKYYYLDLHKSSTKCSINGDELTCYLTFEYNNPLNKVIVLTSSYSFDSLGVELLNISKKPTFIGNVQGLLILLFAFTMVAYFIGTIETAKQKERLVLVASSVFVLALSIQLFAFMSVYTLVSYYLHQQQRKNALSVKANIGLNLAVLLSVKFAIPIGSNIFYIDFFVIPIGLSYLFAKQIDVSLKIFSGEVTEIKIAKFLNYSLFWPTYAAGPISQITLFNVNEGRVSESDRWIAIERISRGFFKKAFSDVLYNSYYSEYTPSLFISSSSPEELWILLLANMVFVYLDFSAYSDIAVGTSRLMGIKIPENFNNPLFKKGMRQFWQNWHISLGQWVNRNVFMPLALSLRYEHRNIQYLFPIFFTMLTIGMWHAFSITWFLWALHHTVGIMLSDFLSQFGKKHIEHRISHSTVVCFFYDKMKLILGIGFVWFWFMLSFNFTLTNNVQLSIDNYLKAMSVFF